MKAAGRSSRRRREDQARPSSSAQAASAASRVREPGRAPRRAGRRARRRREAGAPGRRAGVGEGKEVGAASTGAVLKGRRRGRRRRGEGGRRRGVADSEDGEPSGSRPREREEPRRSRLEHLERRHVAGVADDPARSARRPAASSTSVLPSILRRVMRPKSPRRPTKRSPLAALAGSRATPTPAPTCGSSAKPRAGARRLLAGPPRRRSRRRRPSSADGPWRRAGRTHRRAGWPGGGPCSRAGRPPLWVKSRLGPARRRLRLRRRGGGRGGRSWGARARRRGRRPGGLGHLGGVDGRRDSAADGTRRERRRLASGPTASRRRRAGGHVGLLGGDRPSSSRRRAPPSKAGHGVAQGRPGPRAKRSRGRGPPRGGGADRPARRLRRKPG